ncbi:GNAT family N-acetyltransferase [Arthrobacter sp. CDRTa11]|uniref:GNAT family N-acetyltransferase n=1 Tax=Arthrobacter sp. CDRTa11 TaxID=2651199 RepID=UPI0022658A9D|nr:GNAT family N-acetyltransferase [Arthrobacter sp. CDRTa11]UZX03673.1 GNAT family N-acetyltransferase [Arthrobacter sp. CDRTa11]
MKNHPAGHLATAAAGWESVERLFGTRGEPSRCWCRYFALTGPEYSALDPAARKALLKERFDAGTPAPGVLAYRDGEPVGWCAVEPRECYPRVLNSQLLRRAKASAGDTGTDDEASPETVTGELAPGEGAAGGAPARAPESIWAVTCFVVDPRHRRSGVAAALLQAAVEHAGTNGARILEGYPVDPSLRPKAGAADLYHGTLNLFLEAGFKVVSTAVPGRAVVRLQLDH